MAHRANRELELAGFLKPGEPPGCCVADFHEFSQLGRGAYGTCYRVRSRLDGKVYAMKKINARFMDDKQQRRALDEVKLLKRVSHPHIIEHHNSFFEDSSLHIIMEYAEGGDLEQFLQRRKKARNPVEEPLLWRLCYELCQALAYLHDRDIMHRDLKPLNVFLTGDMRVKVGDFGLSKNVEEMGHTRVGTPLYLAPELVQHQRYGTKVDMWALGILLYMLTGLQAPFSGENLITLGYSIAHRKPRPLPADYSVGWRQLIELLLAKKQSQRPDVHAVLARLPAHLTGQEPREGLSRRAARPQSARPRAERERDNRERDARRDGSVEVRSVDVRSAPHERIPRSWAEKREDAREKRRLARDQAWAEQRDPAWATDVEKRPPAPARSAWGEPQPPLVSTPPEKQVVDPPREELQRRIASAWAAAVPMSIPARPSTARRVGVRDLTATPRREDTEDLTDCEIISRPLPPGSPATSSGQTTVERLAGLERRPSLEGARPASARLGRTEPLQCPSITPVARPSSAAARSAVRAAPPEPHVPRLQARKDCSDSPVRVEYTRERAEYSGAARPARPLRARDGLWAQPVDEIPCKIPEEPHRGRDPDADRLTRPVTAGLVRGRGRDWPAHGVDGRPQSARGWDRWAGPVGRPKTPSRMRPSVADLQS